MNNNGTLAPKDRANQASERRLYQFMSDAVVMDRAEELLGKMPGGGNTAEFVRRCIAMGVEQLEREVTAVEEARA